MIEVEEVIPDDTHAVALRMPEAVARKLDRLAETWLCHRHQIMVDLIAPGLEALAAAADRGEPLVFPPGQNRPGRKRAMTLRLRAELAEALDRVLARHGAIKSQIVLRLLVPAIERLYQQELGAEGGG